VVMLLELEIIDKVGFPGIVLEIMQLDMAGLLGVPGLTGVRD
jgi:hypothetical protein